MRTLEQAVALDVRLPVAVLPFFGEDVTSLQSKYGAVFPQRKISFMQVAWGAEATVEKAKDMHRKVDEVTQWVCAGCKEKNARNRINCRTCRRERFDQASGTDRKAKIRAVTSNSREATELRRKLHARLRTQYQRQLEELEDVTKLSAML